MFTVLAALFLIVASVSMASAQRMQMSAEARAKMLKDSLALNDDQLAKVTKIYQDADKKRQDMFSSGSDDRQARMQAMRSLMDTTDVKIEGLLTDTQKTKYEEMKKQRMERMQGMRRRPSNQ